jgi:3-deoxy-manno-octulosonate cytidylyltransferase (CMP-KDO synthetase)
MIDFAVVIPARLDSKRLPRKALELIHHKPLIQWVYERAIASDAKEVLIATDSEEISSVANSFGATAVMTSQKHKSGTDRIFEVATLNNWSNDKIIVNLQGDNPLMPSENINQIARMAEECDIATLSAPLKDHEIDDPNIVKVSSNNATNEAIFFKRLIQDQSDSDNLKRHIGIYAYSVKTLREFSLSPQSEDEKRDKLEQLRAYSLGLKIKIETASIIPGPDVDTYEDLTLVQSILEHE